MAGSAKKHRAARFLAAFAACFVLLNVLTFSESRPSAGDISERAIIIGTYLIDFEALNAETQALAEKNAEDTSQLRVYYKSDLNSGVWYDITDAENVNDIAISNSKVVDNKVIDALVLTKYFKADGTIVDFETGKTVDIKDITSPTDPSNIDAVKSLDKQLEIVKELFDNTDPDGDSEEKAKRGNYYAEKRALEGIMKDIDDDSAKTLKNKQEALGNAIAAAKDETVKDTLGALLNKTRLELEKYCGEQVEARIEEAIETLSKRDNNAHSELISMLSDCKTELAGDDSELGSQIGAEPSDMVGKKKKALEDEIIDAAISGDTDAVKKKCETMSVLDAMINGEETDPDIAAELCNEMYSDALNQVSDDISQALSGNTEHFGESGAVTSADAAAQIESAISDAAGFAKSEAAYEAGTDSLKYNELLADKLSKLGETLSALCEAGGSGELAEAALEAASESAEDILSEAAAAQAMTGGDLAESLEKISALEQQKEELQTKYQDALETGDSAKAEQYSKQLDALSDSLDKERGQPAADINAAFKKLAEGKAALSANPAAENAGQLKKDIRDAEAKISAVKQLMSDVDEAMLETLSEAVDALDDAAASKNEDTASDAYENLTEALSNAPDLCVDAQTKADLLSAALAAFNGAGIDALNDEINKDMEKAKNGEFSSEKTEQDPQAPEPDQSPKPVQPPEPDSDSENKELLNEALDALEKIKVAAENGGAAAAKSAYESLKACLEKVPDNVLDNNGKATMLSLAKDIIDSAGVTALGEEITADIQKALDGGFSYEENPKPATGGEEKEQLNEALDALEKIKVAVENGGAAAAKSAYESLKDCLEKVPDTILDNNGKANMLALAKDSIDRAGVTALDEEIAADIQKALDGGFSSEENPKPATGGEEKERLNEALDALEKIKAAAENGGTAAAKGAYESLKDCLEKVPDTILDNNGKANMLALAKDSIDRAGVTALDEEIVADIQKALDGGFSSEKEPEPTAEELRKQAEDTIKDLLKGLAETESELAANGLGADEMQTETAAAANSAAEQLLFLPAEEKAAFEQLIDGIEQLIKDSGGDKNKAEQAYDNFFTALGGVSDACADIPVRMALLNMAMDILDANGITALDDKINSDIIELLTGSAPVPDEPQESGEGTVYDEMYAYKLVVARYDIYSNTMSVDLDGTVYINVGAFVRETKSQFIRSDDVYVIKDDGVLIEFSADSKTAYVGDKLLLLSVCPFAVGDAVFAPSELIANGFGFEEQTENGCTFFR